ncbi:hypothetical protein MMC29_001820 [Sticta canariensis]|nr:hypothetical protein [Sticta canariensis]
MNSTGHSVEQILSAMKKELYSASYETDMSPQDESAFWQEFEGERSVKQILIAMKKELHMDSSETDSCHQDESIAEFVPQKPAHKEDTEDITEEKFPEEALTYTPLGIHTVEFTDCASGEVKSIISGMQPPKEDSEAIKLKAVHEGPNVISEESEEDTNADSLDFYESCKPEFSYEEDTTEYTSMWTTEPKPAKDVAAMCPALFSEDSHRSKVDKPKSVVSSPQAAAGTAKTNFVAEWLDSSTKIYEQDRVASFSTDAQAGTSDDIEGGKQSQVEVSAVHCEVGTFSSLSDVEAMLASALTVVGQYESSSERLEETEESAPLSLVLSGGSISTQSCLPSGTVVDNFVREAGMAPTKLHGTEPKKEAIFSPPVQKNSGYQGVSVTHDINKLAAEETAAWKDVWIGLRAMEPFMSRKFDFQTACEAKVEDMGEGESEKEKEGTYALSNIPNEPATKEKLVAEILCGDLDQIPLEPGPNETFYGPIAIAVGHKAYRLADWISSRLW